MLFWLCKSTADSFYFWLKKLSTSSTATEKNSEKIWEKKLDAQGIELSHWIFAFSVNWKLGTRYVSTYKYNNFISLMQYFQHNGSSTSS